MTYKIPTYRDFNLTLDFDAPAVFRVSITHVDYDGPEDSRHGAAPSISAAKDMIDEFWLEYQEGEVAPYLG